MLAQILHTLPSAPPQTAAPPRDNSCPLRKSPKHPLAQVQRQRFHSAPPQPAPNRNQISSDSETAAAKASHGELRVKGFFIWSCVKLRWQFRYPRSEPDCMTQLVSEHDQPHKRSPLKTAAPTSRLRRAGAQAGETILEIDVSGHGFHRFAHPDPPEPMIRSWKI